MEVLRRVAVGETNVRPLCHSLQADGAPRRARGSRRRALAPQL